MFSSSCPVCGAIQWRPLTNIRDDRSVRTDGGIIARPLNKLHCMKCGLGIRIANDQDPSVLYADDYQLYSNRPGAEQFDAGRYTTLADALIAAWGGRVAPKRVLEVGCGDGSLLQALQLRWQGSSCVGLEPSGSAVDRARQSHRAVFQGMIGQFIPNTIAEERFNLIYAIHVIEHTPDPSVFLENLSALLAPGGLIVITCPDGAIPHAELTHPDHLYSMTPKHLAAFAQRGGQTVILQDRCPATQAEFSQLMVCAPSQPVDFEMLDASPDAFALYQDRQAYLNIWKGLEDHLMNTMRFDLPLYCFGAGGWTGNIAGYCPALWDRVVACAVDRGDGTRVHGKDVLDYGTLSDKKRQFIAVVNPSSQARIAKRLIQDGHLVISWPSKLTA